jgi:hypothetical protein
VLVRSLLHNEKFNAKTQRRQVAKNRTEKGMLVKKDSLYRSCIKKIFFAPLRLGVDYVTTID